MVKRGVRHALRARKIQYGAEYPVGLDSQSSMSVLRQATLLAPRLTEAGNSPSVIFLQLVVRDSLVRIVSSLSLIKVVRIDSCGYRVGCDGGGDCVVTQ
jgi:hypothetical protein